MRDYHCREEEDALFELCASLGSGSRRPFLRQIDGHMVSIAGLTILAWLLAILRYDLFNSVYVNIYGLHGDHAHWLIAGRAAFAFLLLCAYLIARWAGRGLEIVIALALAVATLSLGADFGSRLLHSANLQNASLMFVVFLRASIVLILANELYALLRGKRDDREYGGC